MYDELSWEQRLTLAGGPLCCWYLQQKRALPWRESTSPYRVWISEIMLQQTRSETVKPYFMRFMEEVPDIPALARIDDDRLMKLWEGLGYYSRARNLKKAAGICMERYGGRLPESYVELLTLPGIGSYTAGAISSIAWQERRPAVDGNVLRVLHRLWEDDSDITKPEIKKKLEELLTLFLSDHPEYVPGVFNQALMELGACVCIPHGMPHCDACPVSELCLACRHKSCGRIPYKPSRGVRRQEDRTVFLLFDDSGIVLHKRPDKGLLAGLYELPAAEGCLDERQACDYWQELLGETVSVRALASGKHVFSHIQWNMTAWHIRLRGRVETYKKILEAHNFEVPSLEKARTQYTLSSAFSAWRDIWETAEI